MKLKYTLCLIALVLMGTIAASAQNLAVKNLDLAALCNLLEDGQQIVLTEDK